MDRLVEVDIMQKAARPFFDMDTGDSIIRCLVDTGAEIPVWCFDADLLKSVFPDCEPTAFATFISGFGKGRTYADIYKIACNMILTVLMLHLCYTQNRNMRMCPRYASFRLRFVHVKASNPLTHGTGFGRNH